MTSLLGSMVVDDPCSRCGDRRVWVMQYHSCRYDRFVCICKACGNTLVVKPTPALLTLANRSEFEGSR